MRLTAKIAAAGETYMGRFPTLPINIEDLCDGPDKLSVAKIRTALREYDEFIQWASDDDPGVLALAVEFMRQMDAVTRRLAENPEADARTEAAKPVDRSLERRLEGGRFAYVRFDIDRYHGRPRVRVAYSNPRGAVGAVLESCRRFAVYAARVLNHIADGLGEKVGVQLVGIGEADDVFAEARWADEMFRRRDEVDAANANRAKCPRRLGQYCSPSDPGCVCYRDGRCVAAELTSEWKAYKRKD